MDIEDAGCQVKYLIRDRDGKYPALFGVVLAEAGIEVVLDGVRMRPFERCGGALAADPPARTAGPDADLKQAASA